MKRSHPNYSLPCARLKNFTSLDETSLIEQQNFLMMSTYHTQCQNIGRIEKHADTDLHIQANVCERHYGHLSHRLLKIVRH
jgi:hypothetical protein